MLQLNIKGKINDGKNASAFSNYCNTHKTADSQPVKENLTKNSDKK